MARAASPALGRRQARVKEIAAPISAASVTTRATQRQWVGIASRLSDQARTASGASKAITLTQAQRAARAAWRRPAVASTNGVTAEVVVSVKVLIGLFFGRR